MEKHSDTENQFIREKIIGLGERSIRKSYYPQLIKQINALRESEERFRRMADNIQDGLTIIEHGHVTFINNRMCEITGYDKDELLSMSVFDLAAPEEKQRLELVMNDAKKTGKLPDQLEFWIEHKDGSKRCIRNRYSSSTENGKIIGRYVITTDITDQKKAERKMLESDNRYRNLFDNAADIIAVLDKKGCFLDLNKRFEEESNYQKEEILGKNIFTSGIVTKKSILKISPYLTSVIKGHHIPSFEIEGRKKNGEIVPYEIRAVPIKKDDTIIGIQAILRNLTERKEAETKLRQAHEELITLNKTLEKKVQQRTEQIRELLEQKDEFVNQLGHDLKNPLGPLINLLPILEKRETDPKYLQIIQTMQRNVKYMKNLVTKTIKLAQIQSPNTMFHFEPINIREEICEIIENNKLMFDDHRITVLNNISEDYIIEADKLMVYEVFNNLLNNAVKYSDEHGIITIDGWHDESDSITFSITDTGIGMTEEQLTKVFNEFYKADDSRHDFDSSGLGMSICKRIVEKHGGQIWIESEGIGKGTTFYFTFPRTQSSND